MAPHPRVAKAFRAMRQIGIAEEICKPVLKTLLKLYEKNWELIEEENYRALADAIFDAQDSEATEKKKKLENPEREVDLEEEAQVNEEPKRPLKRLRLRYQEAQSEPSPGNSGSRGHHQPESRIVAAFPESNFENSSKVQPVSSQSLGRNKGKQPISPDALAAHERSSAQQAGAAERSQPDTTKRIESDVTTPGRLKDKGKEIHSGDKFSSECTICGSGKNLCPTMLKVQQHRNMNMNQRRLAQSNSEAQAKRLAMARKASLAAQKTDLAIPIAPTGVDEKVVNEGSRKRASTNSRQAKRQRTAPSAQPQGDKPADLESRDEDDDEEDAVVNAEARAEEQDMETDGAGHIEGVQAEDLGETEIPPPPQTNEAAHTTSSPDHQQPTSRTTPRRRVSWPEEDFVVPADEEGLKVLCQEANNIPVLKGLITERREPVECLLGSTALKRSCDAKQVANVQEQDSTHSAYHAGIHLSMISSAILGLNKKCVELESHLEEALTHVETLMADKENLRKRVSRRDGTIQDLKAQKAKADADLQAEITARNQYREELEKKRQDAEDKLLRIAEENERLRTESFVQANQITKLKNDLAEAQKKAESESMDLYDNAILHTLRAVAADALEIPAITPSRLTKWGSETIFSDHCRKGHSLVPYGDDELEQLAEEDAILGKAPWTVPAINANNIIPAWIDYSQKNKDALNSAYAAAKELQKQSNKKMAMSVFDMLPWL